jgi:uncharacterized membrane protein (DUF4010 family)
LGDGFLLVASALSGVADTDAISLSLASLAKTEIGLKTAVLGVILATGANMLSKASFVWFLGSKEVRVKFAGMVILNLFLLAGYSVWWIL